MSQWAASAPGKGLMAPAADIPPGSGGFESTDVMILGSGAVGTVIADQLSRSKHVDRVVAVDTDPAKTGALARKVRSRKVVRRRADARDVTGLAEAMGDVGMVVNATVPMFNLMVMRAALKAKVHYMDLATGGPKGSTEAPELAEQMALGARFGRAHLTALLSMGVDPGCSNIFARHLADRLDRVDELLVRDGDDSTVEGYSFAPLFSPDTLLEECLLPPLVYRNRRFERLAPLSGGEPYDFPRPVGRLPAYYVDHEEVETLPLNIKGLKRCDFKYALGEGFVRTLKALHEIGMTGTRPVRVGGSLVVPKELLVALLPDPATLGPRVRGHSCVGVEASGLEAGRRVRRYMYTLSSHGECFEEHGVTATAFQTGVPPAIAVEMIARGDIARTGAFTPELLDPTPWPAELARHGMAVKVAERA